MKVNMVFLILMSFWASFAVADKCKIMASLNYWNDLTQTQYAALIDHESLSADDFLASRNALLKLGVNTLTDAGGNKKIQVPKNYRILFRKYGEQIDTLVKTGAISKDEIIVPVLVFQNVEISTADDFIFIRPGIDPWPATSSATVLINFEQTPLPPGVWENAVAHGDLPFAVGSHLAYHLKTLAEFIAHPESMKATRAHYAK